MTKLEILNVELNRLFDVFNEEYYSGQLQKPIIAIQTNGGRGRNRYSMGWCTCERIWKDHCTNDYYYEITICSEYLYRSIEEICATLLHEMVHLYCNEKGIKDTSRGNTYHNKRFKEIAESHGLRVTYDERIGWSISQLTPQTAMLVEQKADKAAFVITRERHAPPKPPKATISPIDGESVGNTLESGTEGAEGAEESTEKEKKPKQSLRKYVCPKCGCIIRASREVNVICGECKIPFEKQETQG